MIKLLKQCQESHPDFETNCWGFLKDVCQALGVTIDQGNADAIADFLEANWTELKSHADAKKPVDEKKFVVAALKSSDSNKDPKPSNGHVAIVGPGELYRQIYPKVYCGGMSAAGRSAGNKSVGEVWSKVDRDSVSYYQSLITPKELFDECG